MLEICAILSVCPALAGFRSVCLSSIVTVAAWCVCGGQHTFT